MYIKFISSVNKFYLSEGHIEVLQKILDSDKHIMNNRDENGNTPLHCGKLTFVRAKLPLFLNILKLIIYKRFLKRNIMQIQTYS